MIRTVDAAKVSDTVAKLCVEANFKAPKDVVDALARALRAERSPLGKDILRTLRENIRIAAADKVAMCQDTGMAVVFLEVGQDLHVAGGALAKAVNAGVRKGYAEGYLRKSVVDPLTRANTGDNTPAIIHTEIVPGRLLRITVAPKGFGSENMSAIRMFNPTVSRDQVEEFVVGCVRDAGARPCPPTVVGVGIGGTFEHAALLAKKALLVPLGEKQARADLAAVERSLLAKINALGIGPGGLGGATTALAVRALAHPTHIAGLPVAVNICCHALRHASAVL
ncbi:MAG TPA: fumarate hydratase [bacterium]|nr:fumarate hydratase [bacterium]